MTRGVFGSPAHCRPPAEAGTTGDRDRRDDIADVGLVHAVTSSDRSLVVLMARIVRPAWHSDALCKEHPEADRHPTHRDRWGAPHVAAQRIHRRPGGRWIAVMTLDQWVVTQREATA